MPGRFIGHLNNGRVCAKLSIHQKEDVTSLLSSEATVAAIPERMEDRWCCATGCSSPALPAEIN